jgi:hypothetical protein
VVFVKIELWPSDIEDNAVLLGGIAIADDSFSTPSCGNYNATLVSNEGVRYKSVRVEGFPRDRLLVFDLLYRVLKAAVGTRNDGTT